MILIIHTKPNSKLSSVIGSFDARSFKIAVHAPAIDGQANDELIRFLSKTLGISKTLITIKRGQTSRVKHIEIPDGSSILGLINPTL